MCSSFGQAERLQAILLQTALVTQAMPELVSLDPGRMLQRLGLHVLGILHGLLCTVALAQSEG